MAMQHNNCLLLFGSARIWIGERWVLDLLEAINNQFLEDVN
jgi:hypothetical protein